MTWLTTILENVIFSGAFFGWANVQPILIDEGFFSEGCPVTSNNSTSNTSTPSPCQYQDESLGLVFSITAATGLIAGLLVGSLLDRIGMWYTRTILVNMALVSYILIAASGSSNILYFAFPVINFAGFGMLLLNSQLNNLFAHHRSFYSTSCVGAFSSASTVYLAFNRLHAAGYGFSHLLYGYAALILLLNVRTFTLTPKRSVPYALPKDYTYGYGEIKACGRNEIAEPTEEGTVEAEAQVDENNPDNASLREAICKIYTLTGWSAAVITQFSSSFYISSLNMFLRSTLVESTKVNVDLYTNVFGSVQACSLLFAPIGGLLVDYAKRRFVTRDAMSETLAGIKSCAVGFALGSSCLIIMSVCTLIPIDGLHFFAMLAQVLARTFFFGVWTMFMSLVYPSRHFGKVFGIVALLCGAATLLQYPLTLLLTRVLNEQFVSVNVGMLLLAILALTHVFVVVHYVSTTNKKKKMKKCRAEEGGMENKVVTLDDEKKI